MLRCSTLKRRALKTPQLTASDSESTPCAPKKEAGLAPLNNTEADEEALYNNANVYSGDLKFLPIGD